MYYPYFRGKQFELIAIREQAELLAKAKFTPVIEPVRSQLKSLERALEAVCEADGQAFVVVNPEHGDHKSDGTNITDLLKENYLDRANISAAILLQETSTTDDAIAALHEQMDHDPMLIHAGFSEADLLLEEIQNDDSLQGVKHGFVEHRTTGRYRRKFRDAESRVLFKDGFEKQRNADYRPSEFFSDVHFEFRETGFGGFGDFLTVGDTYSESGGPAYAVAIHLTYINPDQDDEMYVYHFVSDRTETPTDPAGKFAEALAKLKKIYETGTSNLYRGTALDEFLDLEKRGHFPGLGHVKKLSMVHHLETMAHYLAEQSDG